MEQSWGMAAVDPWTSWGESRACVPTGHIGFPGVASPSSDLSWPGTRPEEPDGALGQGVLVQLCLCAELDWRGSEPTPGGKSNGDTSMAGCKKVNVVIQAQCGCEQTLLLRDSASEQGGQCGYLYLGIFLITLEPFPSSVK